MNLLLITLFFAVPLNTFAETGCAAIDKNNPPLFISFEQFDNKSWDGDKYVKGALLKLNNNSNCTIAFEVAYGESRSSGMVLRNGKLVHRDEGSLISLGAGTRVSLVYITKYPNRRSSLGGFGGDLLETAYLKGGDYIFFGVPLKNFQRGGDVLVPYNYDWDEGEQAQIITKDNGNVYRYETVEHYLRFGLGQLPKGTLK